MVALVSWGVGEPTGRQRIHASRWLVVAALAIAASRWTHVLGAVLPDSALRLVPATVVYPWHFLITMTDPAYLGMLFTMLLTMSPRDRSAAEVMDGGMDGGWLVAVALVFVVAGGLRFAGRCWTSAARAVGWIFILYLAGSLLLQSAWVLPMGLAVLNGAGGGLWFLTGALLIGTNVTALSAFVGLLRALRQPRAPAQVRGSQV